MKILIEVKKGKSIIKLGERSREIDSDRTFSQNILPAIDELIKEVKLGDFPEVEVRCAEDSSMMSCNVAKATAKGLNLE
jgi:hypothetical protein